MKKIKELYQKNAEIINYLIVGVLTTCVSIGTYYLCVSTFLDANKGIQLQIANVISWLCAVIFAFFTNKIFVFKSKNKKVWKEFFSFVSSRIITLLLGMLIMFLMVTVLSINDKISKLVVQVVVTILNYVFSKLLVFKKEKVKND